MEGNSRGGAAVSVTEVTGVPIKFLGISEKIDGFEINYHDQSKRIINIKLEIIKLGVYLKINFFMKK